MKKVETKFIQNFGAKLNNCTLESIPDASETKRLILNQEETFDLLYKTDRTV